MNWWSDEGQRETHPINTQQDDQGSGGSCGTRNQSDLTRQNKTGNTTQRQRAREAWQAGWNTRDRQLGHKKDETKRTRN